MDTCTVCQKTSRDKTEFLGTTEYTICLSCHLALVEESQDAITGVDQFEANRYSQTRLIPEHKTQLCFVCNKVKRVKDMDIMQGVCHVCLSKRSKGDGKPPAIRDIHNSA